MRSRAIEELKRELKLTSEQREVLVGLLLGDGCLESQNGGRTYRLKIEQSKAHEAYVTALYGLFERWTLSPPRVRVVNSRGHISENIAFGTVSHVDLRFYANQFYLERKKCVPLMIGELLTPRGLAFWFMDDGSIKSKESKGVILNTQGFADECVLRLIRVLQEKFGLQCWKREQKDGGQIYISGHSFEKFVEIVDPYMVPEMRYKIPPPRCNTIAQMVTEAFKGSLKTVGNRL